MGKEKRMIERRTGLEDHQRLEADLDLGQQGLDADNKVEHDLELGGDEHVNVKSETVEGGHAVLKDLEVGLEVYEDLKKRVSVDVDVDVGNDVSWEPLLSVRSPGGRGINIRVPGWQTYRSGPAGP